MKTKLKNSFFFRILIETSVYLEIIFRKHIEGKGKKRKETKNIERSSDQRMIYRLSIRPFF